MTRLEGNPQVVLRAHWLWQRYAHDRSMGGTVADSILGPWQEVGQAHGPQLMRTVPGEVRGPGHHSLVSSPDGRQDFAVYHAWDPSMTLRQMWVDPLFWTPEGPMIERFQKTIRE